ncbi:MAG: 7-cyano-7-deazaguanine synthase QueC [Gammaproteobacteria bacterium]|nr:7-cyano-7-deazaguanine synthase QueC [Gammaproteobacteria bacterium]
MNQKKAVVLVSGGLDSATILAIAKTQEFECYALSFDYGQRHRAELDAARVVAETMQAQEHRIIQIGLDAFGGSALTDPNIAVPTTQNDGIPVTYVPARNTVFLALALGWAEVLQASDIFIGINAVDYSGYPDCRPEFIKAFQTMANLATKSAIEGQPIEIHTPLIALSKAEIIEFGTKLGVDYSLTVSCYSADEFGQACGSCDSCRFRQEGFKQAGIADPTRYR